MGSAGVSPFPAGSGSAGVDLLPIHPVRSGRSGVRSGRHLRDPFGCRCSLPGPAPGPVGGGRGLGRACMSGRLWRYGAHVAHSAPLQVTSVKPVYTGGPLLADERLKKCRSVCILGETTPHVLFRIFILVYAQMPILEEKFSDTSMTLVWKLEENR